MAGLKISYQDPSGLRPRARNPRVHSASGDGAGRQVPPVKEMTAKQPRKPWKIPLVVALSAALLCAACKPQSGAPLENEVYTLYRNSLLLPNERLHVATFDYSGAGRAAYNMQNCQQASDLFQQQPAVKTRFWCEQGHYKP